MSEIKVLDHGYVKLIRQEGDESEIIEAARMSTDGAFRGWGTGAICPTCKGLGEVPSSNSDTVWANPCGTCAAKGYTGTWGDEKLLRYLYTHKHMTPFEMVGMVLEVQAPIFIFREWHRHRTQSYNEMSGRYIELPSMMYVPSIERLMASKQAITNKQSSAEGITEQQAEEIQQRMKDCNEYCREAYDELLYDGVAKEVARMVLPVTQYSRMRARVNLRNLMGFLELRLPDNVMWEFRQYSQVVDQIATNCFPRTMELFHE